MTPAIKTRPLNLTFEAFLEYDDGTENVYELEDGELELMPEPSKQHEDIGDDLADEFKLESRRCNLDYVVKRFISVKVNSKAGKKPDIIVVPKAVWNAIDPTKPASITRTPLMVVEIVSDGNWRNDYTKKKNYYLGIDVPEYVIIDPLPKASLEFLEVKQPTVSVCTLTGGTYKVKQYREADLVEFATFPELKLTAAQILKQE